MERSNASSQNRVRIFAIDPLNRIHALSAAPGRRAHIGRSGWIAELLPGEPRGRGTEPEVSDIVAADNHRRCRESRSFASHVPSSSSAAAKRGKRRWIFCRPAALVSHRRCSKICFHLAVCGRAISAPFTCPPHVPIGRSISIEMVDGEHVFANNGQFHGPTRHAYPHSDVGAAT